MHGPSRASTRIYTILPIASFFHLFPLLFYWTLHVQCSLNNPCHAMQWGASFAPYCWPQLPWWLPVQCQVQACGLSFPSSAQPAVWSASSVSSAPQTGQLSSRGLFLNSAGVRRYIAGSKPCFAADLGFNEIHVDGSCARRTTPACRSDNGHIQQFWHVKQARNMWHERWWQSG